MPKPPQLEIIYEDNHLLVVNKAAGLATQGVAEGTASVLTRAKEYLKKKYQKPGNVYLGVVSRLDSTVSGLLVLARTSKAADRGCATFQRRFLRLHRNRLVHRSVQTSHPGTHQTSSGPHLASRPADAKRDHRRRIVPPVFRFPGVR